jgi:hypothetical protein
MDRRDFIGQLVGGLVALASLLFPSALAAMSRRPKPADKRRWRHWADFGEGPVYLDMPYEEALDFWNRNQLPKGEFKPALKAVKAFHLL